LIIRLRRTICKSQFCHIQSGNLLQGACQRLH